MPSDAYAPDGCGGNGSICSSPNACEPRRDACAGISPVCDDVLKFERPCGMMRESCCLTSAVDSPCSCAVAAESRRETCDVARSSDAERGCSYVSDDCRRIMDGSRVIDDARRCMPDCSSAAKSPSCIIMFSYTTIGSPSASTTG